MLHKTITVVFALAVASLALPSAASAFGGHGGGHGGGFGGGHGGGFGGFHHGGGFRGGGFGFGLYGYPYGYPYGYDDYYGDGGCHLVLQRIHTRHGWRIRRVEVCE